MTHVTVPREPTEEMVAAGRRFAVPATQAIIPIYVAMLAAAPPSPLPPVRDEIVEALRPLAAWAKLLEDATPDGFPLPATVPHLSLSMRHARAAAKALDSALSNLESGT